MANALKPMEPTPKVLATVLKRKPILWLGAGVSIPAGVPSTWKLLELMDEACEEGLDLTAPFPVVTSQFISQTSESDLSDILQAHIGKSRQPTPFHEAVAQLAAEQNFYSLITTNYDNLMELALHKHGVDHVLQSKEKNIHIKDGFRLIKPHGSFEDWSSVILSQESYDRFEAQNDFLKKQMDLLLLRHNILFAGCSMLDPRILDWILDLDESRRKQVKSWRFLTTANNLSKLAKATHRNHSVSDILAGINARPILLVDYKQLPLLFVELAQAHKSKTEPRPIFNLTAGETITIRLDNGPEIPFQDPTQNDDFKEQLALLRKLERQPLPCDAHGKVTPNCQTHAANLEQLVRHIGSQFTKTALNDEMRQTLMRIINQSLGGTPPLMRIRVHAATAKDRKQADHLLALPWELLFLDDCFPLERGVLDLVREAVVPNAPKPIPPAEPLAVLACIAAPIDAGSLDHEAESMRLWRALGAQEKRLLFTDLGTLDDLARLARHHRTPILHFTGHGSPGGLCFEDDTAHKQVVTVDDLLKEFSNAVPHLFFLSSCHGASLHQSDSAPGEKTRGLSLDPARLTAAGLHRAGLPQVVAYFGSVADQQATRTSAYFYRALAEGATTVAAMRQTRTAASKALPLDSGGFMVYPMGWAQLNLYLRGDDTNPGQVTPGMINIDLHSNDLERRARKLEHDRAVPGVERLQFGFIGRRKPRAEVIGHWRRGKRLLAVHGLGGLGKTALCAETLPILARQMGDAPILALDGRHAGEQEIPIDSLWSQIESGGERLAPNQAAWQEELAALDEVKNKGQRAATALSALAAHCNGLLVYLDDAESLQIPPESGAMGKWCSPELTQLWQWLWEAAESEGRFGVLASTRYIPDGLPQTACLTLPVMALPDLMRLMNWFPTLRQLPLDDRRLLAQRVDGHPRTIVYLEGLALKQAKRLGVQEVTFKKVIQPLLPEAAQELSARLLLEILWQQLSPEYRDLLGQCSQISEPSPWPALATLTDDDDVLEGLQRLGLLCAYRAPLGQGTWWGVHRLVAERVSEWWSGDPIRVQSCLGDWFLEDWQADKARSDSAQRAVAHLLAAGAANRAWPPAKDLVIQLRDAGRYHDALATVNGVIDAGPDGTVLGNVLVFQVQLEMYAGLIAEDGETRLLQALDLVTEKDLGFTNNTLARWYHNRGLLSKAAKAHKKAVDIYSSLDGENQVDLGISLNSLAGVLKAQGELSAAREMLERALVIWEEVFGGDRHPEVAASLHSLAGVLKAQGELSAAREMLERALVILEEVFGSDRHPSVAASLHSLAVVLQAQGELSAAREMLERVLVIEAAIYGSADHYSTAMTEEDLGLLLFELAELEPDSADTHIMRVVELLGHALMVYRKQLGPSHHLTIKLVKVVGIDLPDGPD